MPDTIVAALLAGLTGVIVGGLITYLTTSSIETQKWEQQKKDKEAQDRRERLNQLMDWVAPIQTDVITATALAKPTVMETNPSERPWSWWQRWSTCLAKIAQSSGPPSTLYLDSWELFSGGHIILSALTRFHLLEWALSDQRNNATVSDGMEPEGLHLDSKYDIEIRQLEARVVEGLDELQVLSVEYRKQIQQEYDATYK